VPVPSIYEGSSFVENFLNTKSIGNFGNPTNSVEGAGDKEPIAIKD